VYANPVKPQRQAFDPKGPFWSGIRNYLRTAAAERLPALLLIMTTGLRGKTAIYDRAINSILEEIEDYSLEIPSELEPAIVKGTMPKKYQLCIPYWLARYSATSEGYGVEVVESLDYIGTGNVRMMHLILKLRRRVDDAQPRESALLRLVNFPHRTLESVGSSFRPRSVRLPTIPPPNGG
jgi:hypothetical protein